MAGPPPFESEPLPHLFESIGDHLGVGEVALGQFQLGEVGPGVGACHRLQPPAHLVVVVDIAEVLGNLPVGVRGADCPLPARRAGQRAQDAVPVRHSAAQPVVEHHRDPPVGLGPDEPPDTLGEAESRTRHDVVGEGILAAEFHRRHAGTHHRLRGGVEGDLLDDQQAEGLAWHVHALPE